MAYRKERGYDLLHLDRGVPYLREPDDRRPGFSRPNGDYSRNYDYDDRYTNGGPRNYHGDHRSYHGDGGPFMNERRSGPPRREDGFPHYRDEPYGGRYGDFRNSRTGPLPTFRTRGFYHRPRALPAAVPEGGGDTLMQAILSLDRGYAHLPGVLRGKGDHRDGCRRKAPFPPQRERSPFRKDIPPSPHSRSGSSLSSRSYSPERSKGYSYQSQQRKRYEESYSQGRESEKDRPSSYSVSASRDGSPQSSSSASKVSAEKSNRASDPHPAEVPSEKADKPMETTDSSEAQEEFREPCRTSPPPEEVCQLEGEQEASLTAEDEAARIKSDFQERRSQAIATKAREIEKVYRQDCETFGMVVKMLVAKDPSLEKQLQNPLKENLCEIRERCLEDLKHFISELDEVVLHSEGLD